MCAQKHLPCLLAPRLASTLLSRGEALKAVMLECRRAFPKTMFAAIQIASKMVRSGGMDDKWCLVTPSDSRDILTRW